MRLAGMLFAAGAVALSGCNNGAINLPDVNLTIPIVESVKIGPASGVTPGIPVVAVPFDLGEFCDIIDPDAIAAQIQDALGETAAGLIEVESISLKGVVFSARNGSFATFDEFALSITPKGGAEIPFGDISASDGLGSGFTITTENPIDVLDFFASTDCFSAELTLTGTTPSVNLDMRLDAFVTVSSRVSVVKGLFGL
jgi:hypothetical protein